MKKIVLFSASILLIASFGWRAFQPSATPDAFNGFVTLCASPSFQNLHENPLPYHHKSEDGEMISLPISGEEDGKAFSLAATEPTDKYVFVIHEWWGLNGHIKREAEKLYHALGMKVNILALDLYDGQVGTTREEASTLMRGIDKERLFKIIASAKEYAGEEAQIGTIGWCFGGGWSLQASIALGDQAAGCVIYYGWPEKDIERLKTLETKVLGIFGTKDQGIPASLIQSFEKNMAAAGKDLTVHNFDAGHGFANPSNPNHVKKATEEAWALSLAFFNEQLALK